LQRSVNASMTTQEDFMSTSLLPSTSTSSFLRRKRVQTGPGRTSLAKVAFASSSVFPRPVDRSGPSTAHCGFPSRGPAYGSQHSIVTARHSQIPTNICTIPQIECKCFGDMKTRQTLQKNHSTLLCYSECVRSALDSCVNSFLTNWPKTCFQT
jgi:hypothetical protein